MVSQESFPLEAKPLYAAVWTQPFDQETRENFDTALHVFGHQAGLAAGRAFLGAKIDEEDRLFRFWWGQHWLDRRPYSTGFSPDAADYALGPSLGFGKTAIGIVRQGANWVWGDMTDTFNARVDAGEVKILARLGSPTATEVTALSADSWVQFHTTDWRRGIATCPPTEEQLFSIHAIDAGRPASVTRRTPEGEAMAALQSEFLRRQAMRMPPLTLRETIEWAKAHNLPRRFARDARMVIPADLKLKPGEKLRDYKPD